MALEQDLVIDQDSKFSYTVSVTFDGVLVPLTGYTARMQIRDSRQPGATVLATFTSPSGGLSIVGAAAQVLIDIPGATSLAWDFDRAVYDLYVYESGSAEPHRVMQGTVTVSRNVTAPS